MTQIVSVFSVFCSCWRRQAGENSAKIKIQNDVLVLLTGLNISGRIRLLRSVPWGTVTLPAVPGCTVDIL